MKPLSANGVNKTDGELKGNGEHRGPVRPHNGSEDHKVGVIDPLRYLYTIWPSDALRWVHGTHASSSKYHTCMPSSSATFFIPMFSMMYLVGRPLYLPDVSPMQILSGCTPTSMRPWAMERIVSWLLFPGKESSVLQLGLMIISPLVPSQVSRGRPSV